MHDNLVRWLESLSGNEARVAEFVLGILIALFILYITVPLIALLHRDPPP